MGSHVVVPYSEDLKLLVDHLQQLMMESLGKRVTQEGELVDFPTGLPIWGGVGTAAQHSFFQLLQQGTESFSVDLIGFANPSSKTEDPELQVEFQEQQKELNDNLLAQAEVLANGSASADPHKVLPGNRPSNIIMADKLTPETLGALIALYEHITFVWGEVLGINPFDQYGVEAGKKKALELAAQGK
jgi:glucose-6-phosphate isomerase